MSEWQKVDYIGGIGTAFRKDTPRDSEVVVLAQCANSIEIGVAVMGTGIRHSMDAETALMLADAIRAAAAHPSKETNDDE